MAAPSLLVICFFIFHYKDILPWERKAYPLRIKFLINQMPEVTWNNEFELITFKENRRYWTYTYQIVLWFYKKTSSICGMVLRTTSR